MPNVFICYRRADAAADARLLYDRLCKSLGKDAVFLDVSIERENIGGDFHAMVLERINKCDVVLALIGNHWPTERLHEIDDLVRMEIEAALHNRQANVIPVIVGTRAMVPSASVLPDQMVIDALAKRQ